MCNNNLAAPQRKFETSIFLWISRHGGRLAGSSGTKLIGEHKISAWFQHLPGNWCFLSIKNQRSLRKIQTPAAALNKAKICPFSSTFLKSISWDSPFKNSFFHNFFFYGCTFSQPFPLFCSEEIYILNFFFYDFLILFLSVQFLFPLTFSWFFLKSTL